jgi:hypothetical protein
MKPILESIIVESSTPRMGALIHIAAVYDLGKFSVFLKLPEGTMLMSALQIGTRVKWGAQITRLWEAPMCPKEATVQQLQL